MSLRWTRVLLILHCIYSRNRPLSRSLQERCSAAPNVFPRPASSSFPRRLRSYPHFCALVCILSASAFLPALIALPAQPRPHGAAPHRVVTYSLRRPVVESSARDEASTVSPDTSVRSSNTRESTTPEEEQGLRVNVDVHDDLQSSQEADLLASTRDVLASGLIPEAQTVPGPCLEKTGNSCDVSSAQGG